MSAVDKGVVGESAELAEARPHLRRRTLEQPAATEGKQRVAAEKRPCFLEPVSDMADRVPGNLDHPRLLPADGNLVALADGNVDAGDPTSVVPVADDGATRGLLELQVAAHMVMMMMGVEDQRQRPAETVQGFQNRAGDRRIHRGAGARLGIARQVDVIVRKDRNLMNFEHNHATDHDKHR